MANARHSAFKCKEQSAATVNPNQWIYDRVHKTTIDYSSRQVSLSYLAFVYSPPLKAYYRVAQTSATTADSFWEFSIIPAAPVSAELNQFSLQLDPQVVEQAAIRRLEFQPTLWAVWTMIGIPRLPRSKETMNWGGWRTLLTQILQHQFIGTFSTQLLQLNPAANFALDLNYKHILFE